MGCRPLERGVSGRTGSAEAAGGVEYQQQGGGRELVQATIRFSVAPSLSLRLAVSGLNRIRAETYYAGRADTMSGRACQDNRNQFVGGGAFVLPCHVAGAGELGSLDGSLQAWKTLEVSTATLVKSGIVPLCCILGSAGRVRNAVGTRSGTRLKRLQERYNRDTWFACGQVALRTPDPDLPHVRHVTETAPG